MPFTKSNVEDKVPSTASLTSKQKESVANSLLEDGKDESTAIAEAMAAAKRVNKSMTEETENKIDKILTFLEKHFGATKNEKKVLEVIKSTDVELKQATHVVYEPNVPDAHGEWMDEETVRKACHSFNVHCRKANLFHRVETDKVEVVESYILPVDAMVGEREVKKGTWLAVIQYKDDYLWELEKSGELRGVSIGAIAKKVKDD